jgi:hypothetical protein
MASVNRVLLCLPCRWPIFARLYPASSARRSSGANVRCSRAGRRLRDPFPTSTPPTPSPRHILAVARKAPKGQGARACLTAWASIGRDQTETLGGRFWPCANHPAPHSVCFSHPSTVAPSWRPRKAGRAGTRQLPKERSHLSFPFFSIISYFCPPKNLVPHNN